MADKEDSYGDADSYSFSQNCIMELYIKTSSANDEPSFSLGSSFGGIFTSTFISDPNALEKKLTTPNGLSQTPQ
jgi:hypothetical protein